MHFPTIDFAAFFSAVFAATWALNSHNNIKKWFLVLCSYFFYGYWSVEYVGLLLSLSLFNYALALLIGRLIGSRFQKAFLSLGIAVDLGTLVYFKYFNFLIASLLNACSVLGIKMEASFVELAVPVAISFVTFHCIAYLVDVYRGSAKPARSPVDILLYLSFFPHLVAGPIVRPAPFLQQTAQASDPDGIAIGQSIFLILSGLFKKVIIASYLATELVNPAFRSPDNFTSLELLLAVYGYSIQIYCDFSAYTDIAIGVARLLGYQFPQNFNQPYRAQSLQDFWRRWHITLSSWLRDYLYVPLGGNRKGPIRTFINILITMTLGGLWHGANVTFLIWGLMHGLWLVGERLLLNARGLKPILPPALRYAIGVFTTFHFVCFAWIFFRAPTLEIALSYLNRLFAGELSLATVSPWAIALVAMGGMTQLIPYRFTTAFCLRYETAPVLVQVALASLVIFLIAVTSPPGVPAFIYFQF